LYIHLQCGDVEHLLNFVGGKTCVDANARAPVSGPEDTPFAIVTPVIKDPDIKLVGANHSVFDPVWTSWLSTMFRAHLV